MDVTLVIVVAGPVRSTQRVSTVSERRSRDPPERETTTSLMRFVRTPSRVLRSSWAAASSAPATPRTVSHSTVRPACCPCRGERGFPLPSRGEQGHPAGFSGEMQHHVTHCRVHSACCRLGRGDRDTSWASTVVERGRCSVRRGGAGTHCRRVFPLSRREIFHCRRGGEQGQSAGFSGEGDAAPRDPLQSPPACCHCRGERVPDGRVDHCRGGLPLSWREGARKGDAT